MRPQSGANEDANEGTHDPPSGCLLFGPPGSRTFGNGRTLAKTYDQNYWIDAVNGTPAGLSLDFGTDEVGNIVGLTVGAAANNRVYDYDDLNRLTSVVNGSAANVEAFTYDGTGNRTSKRVGPAAATPYTYPATSHRLQAVGGVTRSYDAAGNTTQMPSAANAALTLVYDARNRLSRVDGSGGTVQANHYNGRGERVRKVAGPLDRRFAYDESGRLLGEFDAGGVPQQLFVWMDDQPVAVVEGTALRYIETDHLNTPRALIDPARNVAVWRWDLQVSAFGEHAANEDPDADGSLVKFNLRFPGQYLDAETGVHYNYFRDYEPGTGRYVESDPIGLGGGLSTFAYVNGKPLFNIDPMGLSAMCYQDPCKNVSWPQKEGGMVAGTVRCSGGKPVTCVNPNLCDDLSTDACAIKKRCVTRHENLHASEHVDCSSQPDGPAPPAPPFDKNSAECAAYKMEVPCLSKASCNSARCEAEIGAAQSFAMRQRKKYCDGVGGP